MYEAVRALMAQVVSDEVRTRYRIGALLRTVKNASETYGDSAIERLAERLDVGADTLYRCALVAEHWSAEEMRALILRTNRRGEPLSWSHLVALTKVASSATRRKLVERALAEAWSVRQLTEHVAAERTAARQAHHGESLDDLSVRAAVAEGVQSASRTLSQMAVFMKALDERLADGDGNAALFDDAIDVYRALYGQVGAALDLLQRAKTTSSGRIRVATKARGVADATMDPEDDHEPEVGRRLRVRK